MRTVFALVGRRAAGVLAAGATLALAACGDPAGPQGPGPATQLAVVQAPSGAAAAAPLAEVKVQIQDAAGIRTANADMVTISLAGAGGSGAMLSGTLTVAAVNGEATFSDLSIDRVATGVTLVATATGLTGASSPAFNVVQPVLTVNPGAVDSLIGAGNTILYDVIATDPTNSMPFSVSVSWATDDAAVATIDPVTGLLTVAGNGTTTVSATTPSGAVGSTTFRSATMSATQMATFAFSTNQTLVGIEWDGTNYYLTNGGTNNGEIQTLDGAGAVQTTTAVTLDSRGLVYRSSDGLFYSTPYNNGDVWLVDPTTGATSVAIPGVYTFGQSKIAISPDGTTLYEHLAGTIRVIDFATGMQTGTITGIQYGGDTWGGRAVQTDGTYFYTADAAGTVYVHDDQGRFVTTVSLPHSVSLNGLVLSYANGMLWLSDSGGSSGSLFGYQLAKM
jgi:hypothetical protein